MVTFIVEYLFIYPISNCRWLDPFDTEVGEVGRVRADGQTRFFLTNSQPGDTGNYSCVATNMAGNEKAQLWVVVSGECKPYLTGHTSNMGNSNSPRKVLPSSHTFYG